MWGALLVLVPAVSLVGCDFAGPAPRASDAAIVAKTEPSRTDVPITGRWVVVALDGQAPQPEATPITVMIDADTIRAQSQCVPFPFIYKRRGTRILLGKINPGGVCARGLSHWEQEFDIGMYNADRVTRTADGGLVFSGTGGTVTMRVDAAD